MTSVSWMYVTFLCTVIFTVIGSFIALRMGIAAKRENDNDFTGVNTNVTKVDTNILKTKVEVMEQILVSGQKQSQEIESSAELMINSLSTETESIKKKLTEKFKSTNKLFDSLNEQLSASSSRIEDHFLAIKNPLDSILFETSYEIDFSSTSSQRIDFLNTYKEYLSSLGDYNSILEMTQSGKLPRSLILTYSPTDSLEIIAIKNPNCEYFPSRFNANYSFPFSYREQNFLTAFLPTIKLFFCSELRTNFHPEYGSDLLYEAFGHSSFSRQSNVHYRINFVTKKIQVYISSNNPLILTSNGKVSSIFDCKNGFLGIGIELSDELNIKFNSLGLKYGKQYLKNIPIILQKDKNENLIPFFKDMRSTYFFMYGKDIRSN